MWYCSVKTLVGQLLVTQRQVDKMKKTKVDLIAIIGIIIGVIGIVFPIAWDYYKTKSAVELQLTSFVTLVEKTDQLDKLSITYNGENLNQISRADFVFINTGRIPILQIDLISPLQITFKQGVKILDVKIDSQKPANINAVVALDNQKNSITITFPLLNPDDYIRFSVLVDTKKPEYESSARIVGVSELISTNKVAETSKVTKSISWTVYPVGLIAGFFLLISFVSALPNLRNEIRVRKLIGVNQFFIPKDQLPITYVEFIFNELRFAFIHDEKQKVIGWLKTLPQNTPLNQQQYKSVQDAVNRIARSAKNIPAFFTLIIFGIGGIVYVILQII